MRIRYFMQRNILFIALCFLLCSLTMLTGISVQADTVEQSISVEVSVTAKEEAALKDLSNQTFQIEMTPVDNAPMPEVSKLTLRGNVSGVFGPIVYEEPGTYEYMVVQKAGDSRLLNYDTSQFRVQVFVFYDNEILKSVVVSNRVGGIEKDDMVFQNTVIEKDSVSDTGSLGSPIGSSKIGSPSGTERVQTGDESNLALFVLLGLALMLLTFGVAAIRKNQENTW